MSMSACRDTFAMPIQSPFYASQMIQIVIIQSTWPRRGGAVAW